MKKTGKSNPGDVLLITSVIGNILQAVNQAETANDLRLVRQYLKSVLAEREYLKRQLVLWINEGNRLKLTAKSLSEEIEGLKNIVAGLNIKVKKLQIDYEKKIESLQKEKIEKD